MCQRSKRGPIWRGRFAPLRVEVGTGVRRAATQREQGGTWETPTAYPDGSCPLGYRPTPTECGPRVLHEPHPARLSASLPTHLPTVGTPSRGHAATNSSRPNGRLVVGGEGAVSGLPRGVDSGQRHSRPAGGVPHTVPSGGSQSPSSTRGKAAREVAGATQVPVRAWF